MVEFVVTDREGLTRAVDCPDDQSLMLGLKKNGFEIMAICGGMLSCATCHIHVEPEAYTRLPAPSEFETELLQEGDHFRAGSSRLSCQVRVASQMGGICLALAPED
jgi:2Fe-2S ferredoxin